MFRISCLGFLICSQSSFSTDVYLCIWVPPLFCPMGMCAEHAAKSRPERRDRRLHPQPIFGGARNREQVLAPTLGGITHKMVEVFKGVRYRLLPHSYIRQLSPPPRIYRASRLSADSGRCPTVGLHLAIDFVILQRGRSESSRSCYHGLRIGNNRFTRRFHDTFPSFSIATNNTGGLFFHD